MPTRMRRLCVFGGCMDYAAQGNYCRAHVRAAEQVYERSRAKEHVFYRTARWRRVRAMKLARDPLCEECGAPAGEVHHVRRRRDAPELAYELTNLRSLCKPCHSRATMAEQQVTAVSRPGEQGRR